jgi:hypothetical protein
MIPVLNLEAKIAVSREAHRSSKLVQALLDYSSLPQKIVSGLP